MSMHVNKANYTDSKRRKALVRIMIRRRDKQKKKRKDQPADEGFIYDTTPSGIGVKTPRGETDHVTIQALEELVFGGQVSFKPVRDRKDSTDEESDDKAPSKYDTTGLQRESAAWVDEDDETVSVDISAEPRLKKLRHTEEERSIGGLTYQSRLRTQFQKLSGQPDWAKPQPSKKKKKHDDSSDSSSDEDDGHLLRRAGRVVDTSRQQHLTQGFLDIKRMKDPNQTCRPNAVIQSLEFHPSSNVMLTAGYHKTVDLFQIDGHSNPKLHGIYIEHFPITMAHFTKDGTEVVMTGHHKKAFHVFNIPSGKVTKVPGIRGRSEKFYTNFKISPDNKFLAFLGNDGYIILLSGKTKQWIADLKMNGTVSDIDFTADSKYMLSFGSDGEVYIWDLANRSCVHKFVDEGCISGSAIAVSPNSEYIACGCGSGVVNVYDGSCLHTAQHPTLLKSLMHLTTGADQTQFNPTSEILAISSKRKKAALRLVHLPSMTVFSNWPTTRSPLSFPKVVDFSADSRYLGIGNDKGRALLYRLKHYRTT